MTKVRLDLVSSKSKVFDTNMLLNLNILNYLINQLFKKRTEDCRYNGLRSSVLLIRSYLFSYSSSFNSNNIDKEPNRPVLNYFLYQKPYF